MSTARYIKNNPSCKLKPNNKTCSFFKEFPNLLCATLEAVLNEYNTFLVCKFTVVCRGRPKHERSKE